MILRLDPKTGDYVLVSHKRTVKEDATAARLRETTPKEDIRMVREWVRGQS